MFDVLSEGVDTLYRVLFLFISIQLVSAGGLGFVLRVISTPLNIKFNNKKLNRFDKDLSDLQLFKFYHGINVATKEDAELAALAISRGKIKPQRAWLMLFLPQIGKTKHGKLEWSLVLLFVCYCIGASIFIGYGMAKTSYNHVLLSKNGNDVSMTEFSVKDMVNNKNYNAEDCSNLPKGTNETVSIACHYLTASNPTLQKELSHVIKSSNINIMTNFFSIIFFALLALAVFCSFLIFDGMNDAFCEFKKTELTYRKVRKYKNAFKNAPSKRK